MSSSPSQVTPSNFDNEQLLALARTASLDKLVTRGIAFSHGDVNFTLTGPELCYAVLLALEAKAKDQCQPIGFVVRTFLASRAKDLDVGVGDCEAMLQRMLIERLAKELKTKSVKFVKPYVKRKPSQSGPAPTAAAVSAAAKPLTDASGTPPASKRSFRARSEKQLNPYAVERAQHNHQLRAGQPAALPKKKQAAPGAVGKRRTNKPKVTLTQGVAQSVATEDLALILLGMVETGEDDSGRVQSEKASVPEVLFDTTTISQHGWTTFRHA